MAGRTPAKKAAAKKQAAKQDPADEGGDYTGAKVDAHEKLEPTNPDERVDKPDTDQGDDGGDTAGQKPSDETGDTRDDTYAGAKRDADEAPESSEPDEQVAKPDPDRAQAEVDEGRAPRTAQLEPPAKEAEVKDEKESLTPADVGVERLQIHPATISAANSEDLDPDSVFGPADSEGFRVCQVRLLENSTTSIYDRPVTTLLLAAGQKVTERNAELILNKIRAERA